MQSLGTLLGLAGRSSEEHSPTGLKDTAATRLLTNNTTSPAVLSCIGKSQGWSAEDERRVVGRISLSVSLLTYSVNPVSQFSWVASHCYT